MLNTYLFVVIFFDEVFLLIISPLINFGLKSTVSDNRITTPVCSFSSFLSLTLSLGCSVASNRYLDIDF